MDAVSFFINGKPYTVDTNSGVTANSRLVDFIRDRAGLTGTKIMCREGGCGSCVVSVKSADLKSGRIITRSVNSCLVPVLSCDGWDISTIEKLGNRKSGYHSVQKQLTQFGGTQCGFCTPGMIMSMYSMLESDPNIKSREIEDNMDGNICRCTGYRPILDAFKSLSSDGPPELRECCDIEELGSCPLETKTASSTDCGRNLNSKDLSSASSLKLKLNDGEQWIRCSTLNDAQLAIQSAKADGLKYRLVAGNTSTGIFKLDVDSPFQSYIDISSIPELSITSYDANRGIMLGGGVTLSAAITVLRRASQIPGLQYAAGISKHFKRVANVHIRNVGTIAGNLMIKHEHLEFPSDLFVILEAIGATLKIVAATGGTTSLSPSDFLEYDMEGFIIVSITLPPLSRSYVFRSYKISQRFQNSEAYVNAAFLMNLDRSQEFTVISVPNVVFGGLGSNFTHAASTEAIIVGKSLSDRTTLAAIMNSLGQEVQPVSNPGEASPEYRRKLAQSLMYRYLLSVLGPNVKPEFHSGAKGIPRVLTSGTQIYDTDQSDWPLNKPVPKLESAVQCSGEAKYINDMQPLPGELFGTFVLSTVANADLSSVDASDALKLPGVVKFIQAKDIPGVNNYYVLKSPDITPEEIFASKKIVYAGQPIGLILAETKESSVKASKFVKVQYSNVRNPVVNLKDAIINWETKELVVKDSVIKDYSNGKPEADRVIKGEFSIGSQYGFHMETQTCICVPTEDGMDVFSSTQWADFVQASIAGALNVQNNSINMQVRRIGGGFGNKSSRSAFVASACAIGAHLTNRPVRLVLDLETNMEMIGKRHPYSAKYEVGVSNVGKIQYLHAQIFNDAGFNGNEEDAADAIVYLQNCYAANNWEVTGTKLTTNTPANTWLRAPGTTQAIAIMEYIMEHIAFTLKKDPLAVRAENFIKDGDILYTGSAETQGIFQGENSIPAMLNQTENSACFDERKKLIADFNEKNRWKKRGIAVVPMRYHLGYAGRRYPVLISIYQHDGTVAVCHGGIECGQGINTKVAQAVAHKLKIPLESIQVKPFNNLACANAKMTSSSLTSELCVYSATMACQELLTRIEPIRKKFHKDTPWKAIIRVCGRAGINLTASYLPEPTEEIPEYDIWAVNITEVEIDVLTGEYKISRVDLLEDAGKSLNPEVDIGQIEGALVMGLGLWTTEKLTHDTTTGKLITNNTWTYKPPQTRDIPEDLRITLLSNAPNPFGVLRSKATGEPPLCTSVCVLFALRNAISAARKDIGNNDWFQLDGPVTPEDILRHCLTSSEQFGI